MKRDSRIFVAGGSTLVGAALLERLSQAGYSDLVGVGPDEPDLACESEVERFFEYAKPEYVFLAAGQSGGIEMNRSRPAELMLNNLRVISNTIDAAHRHGVAKLLYLASSCAYPRAAAQPMRPEALGTGPMEMTSEAYATAKYAGWKLCDAYRRQFGCRFITGIPANPFGPHDDFGPETGHVIPSLIRRLHEAAEAGMRTLTVWGTGKPRREFVYSRNLADACLFVVRHYEDEAPVNLGGGTVLSIAELARIAARVVGFRGQLEFDSSKPDGAPIKELDSSKLLGMGWRAAIDFRTALTETYHWYFHHGAKEGLQGACATL